MKLAEALILRVDLQKQIINLIRNNIIMEK